MKKILVAAMVMNGFVVSADTSYEVIGKDEGIVQFDYENGGPPAISHRNTRCVDRAGKYFLEYAA